MTNPLIQILDRHPEYTRLRDAMVNGEGPAGVFGLGESHKGLRGQFRLKYVTVVITVIRIR